MNENVYFEVKIHWLLDTGFDMAFEPVKNSGLSYQMILYM